MRKVLAGICALALAGCLENPYPDSQLGREKNVKEFSLRSLGIPGPILDLRLARADATDSLSLQARGVPFDSVEYVIYATGRHSYSPPLLGTPFPNRIEYHGIVRRPGAGYETLARLPDGGLGADLRKYTIGGILLRAWGPEVSVGTDWGGVYSGTCSDPVRKNAPGTGGIAKGYIDADGAFCLRCFASDLDWGSTTTGRILGNGKIAILRHGEYLSYAAWYDTTDALPFQRHGDSLSATFHLESRSGILDSVRFETVRVKAP